MAGVAQGADWCLPPPVAFVRHRALRAQHLAEAQPPVAQGKYHLVGVERRGLQKPQGAQLYEGRRRGLAYGQGALHYRGAVPDSQGAPGFAAGRVMN